MSRQDQSSHQTDSHAIPHWLSPDSDIIDVVEGNGAYVYDSTGEEYLDFIAQLYCVNAGHSNEAIQTAIEEQLQRIQYVSSAKHNDVRSRFASELADIAPGDLSDVYFAVSGSEANETAVQLARDYMDAPKILTRWRSYHGGTYGAGSLTGDPTMRAAVETQVATTGATKFLPPLGDGTAFDAETPEELATQAADHLEFVIRNEDPDSIAALLTEPVAGTSGSYTAPPGYMERVRELCNEYDILLISDEVITGFGRCGDWFGIQTEGIEPDMLTFAKAATSGYIPLAGVIAREDIGSEVREHGTELGQTFAGNPMACAAGIAALEEYRGGLIENVRDVEPYFADRLRELERHSVVSDVRGRGFLWTVEFRDPETNEPFVDPRVEKEAENPVDTVISEAQQQNVLLGSGRPGTQVCLSPPLIVGELEIDRAVEVLDQAITTVFADA